MTRRLGVYGVTNSEAFQLVLSRLKRVQRIAGGYLASCPNPEHGKKRGDLHRSLSISESADGRVLLHCHANCEIEPIIAALNLTAADLFPKTNGNGSNGNGHRDVAATYDYRDEAGKLLFQVVRTIPKGFFQRKPDSKGGWINKLGKTRRVLFRLPELLAADPEEIVFLVEGETDVQTLTKMGLVATTSPMGAGNWRAEYAKHFEGRRVAMLPDNDKDGRSYVEQAAQSLSGKANSIKVVNLPGLGAAGDVTDWVQAGGTKQALLELVVQTPEWFLPSRMELPTITTNKRQMREITEEALDALRAANDPPRLFQRTGQLCRVRFDERSRPFIETLSEHALRGEMGRAANFVRIDQHGMPTPTPPPLFVVQDAATRPNWEFPRLEAVIQAPVLRQDGSVLDRPGYDAATRLYYAPDTSLVVPVISETPGEAEIAEARQVLDEAVGEFPFVDQSSRANAMALLLTPVLRPAIEGPVPLGLVDAPEKGTGKTLLAEVVAVIAVGRAELMGAPRREEEWQKLITANLAAGSSFFLFDNLRDTIRSAALERALTSNHLSDRILGHSQMVRLPQRATWVATANNAELSGDLARRCYWIRLDAKVSRPWTRTEFTHPDLLLWVREHRGRLLAALLTCARAWFAAGRPKADTPRLGKFEGWCDVVGGVLAHAGIEGFLGNLNTMYEVLDEGHTQWEGFFQAWWEAFGSEPKTVPELVEAMTSEGTESVPGRSLRVSLPEELLEHLDAAGDKRKLNGFSRRLGKALSKRKDVRYGSDGLRLTRREKDAHRGAIQWQVVRDAGFAGVAGFAGPIRNEKTNDGPGRENDSLSSPTNPPNPQTRATDPDPEADEERAAIQQFDGGLTREEAEARVWPGGKPS